MTVENELIRVGDSLFRNRAQSLWLPEYVMPGLANTTFPTEADLFTESETQQYPIGAQYRINDKLYRYCKAGAAMPALGFLKCSYMLCPGKAGNSQHSGYEEALYEDAVAGQTALKIIDTAALKNEYAGAHMVIYNVGGKAWEQHEVLGNDLHGTAYTVIYIAPPGLKNAVAGVSGTGPGVTINLSQYRDIREYSAGGGWASAVGVAGLVITEAFYFWLQTAGKVSGLTFGNSYSLGETQYQRNVFVNTDGSVIGSEGTTYIAHQQIGYILSRTASDYADCFIQLQLDIPMS